MTIPSFHSWAESSLSHRNLWIGSRYSMSLVRLCSYRLCFSVSNWSKQSFYGFYAVWLDHSFKECMKITHAIPPTKEDWAGIGNCLGLFLLEVSGPRVFSGIGFSVVFSIVTFFLFNGTHTHTSGSWPLPRNCWQNTKRREPNVCVCVLLRSAGCCFLCNYNSKCVPGFGHSFSPLRWGIWRFFFFFSVEQFAALFLSSLVLFLMFAYALSRWVVCF